MDFAPIPALVIGNDPLARRGLVDDLRRAGEVDPVGQGAPVQLDSLHDSVHADVVVWDLGPSAPVLPDEPLPLPWLALASDAQAAQSALTAGAHGAIERHAAPDRVGRAASAVAAGFWVLDTPFGPVQLGTDQGRRKNAPPPVDLTTRESQVLELMAEGLSNREIAEQLGVSPNTAKFHVKAILDKFGAQTRTEAVVLAARSGMLQL